MKLFKLADAPLKGTHLIEAGAGTGKTYSIASIFLRLILEHELNVSEILVLTYTRAATLELKDRVRARLAEMKRVLTDPCVSKDELCEHLRQTAVNKDLVTKWVFLLEGALADFDNANICNFHQFCQKIIKDYAVETGGLFDAEILADNSLLLEQAAEDFWRKSVYHAEPLLAGYLSDNFETADLLKLAREVNSFNTNQNLDAVLPPKLKFKANDLTAHMQEINRFFAAMRTMWNEQRSAIIALVSGEHLHKSAYGARVASMIAEMDVFLKGLLPYPMLKQGEKWRQDYLRVKTNKGKPAPQHLFFQLCQNMANAYTAFEQEAKVYIHNLKIDAAAYINLKMESLKQLQNQIDFNDQINIVGRAVLNNSNKALSRQLKNSFKAVMVDEFQDTDALQYAMFSSLFANAEHLFFMIGDPKQAIYTFRGADVFSYFAAAKNTESKFSLSTNWRSASNLVYAVNHVFKAHKTDPFVVKDIAFVDAVANAEKTSMFNDAPLVFWYLDSRRPELGGKPDKAKGYVLSKDSAASAAVRAVAREILKLLKQNQNLKLKDFAVLVNTNREARLVYRALSRLNIPATLNAREGVYETPEAQELLLILESVSQPENLQKLKAAYTTSVLGGVSAEYMAEAENENIWLERLQKIRQWHKLYAERGFLNMFLSMVFAENSFSRLLKAENGRRKVTNFIHLAELLHNAAQTLNLTLTGLARFLYKAVTNPAAFASDETSLRLETDGDVVQIVTVHKSKGLEYEIVFYPFAWEGVRGRNQEIYKYHKENDLKLDFDENSPAFKQYLRESLAEKVRLLYVALTRAKQRCYVAYGRVATSARAKEDGFETAALTYLLLTQDLDSQDHDLTINMQKAFGGSACNDETIRGALNALAQKAQNRISVTDLPVAGVYAEEKYTVAQATAQVLRTMPKPLSANWKVASFSSLTKISETMDDAFEGRDFEQDTDNEPEPVVYTEEFAQLPEPFSIFSLPKGAHVGNFFHDLLENSDFATTAQTPPMALIDQKLKEYNLDERFAPAIGKLLVNLCNANLAQSPIPVVLKNVRAFLKEMEFYFPLKPVTQEALRALFLNGDLGEIPAAFKEQGGRFVFAPAEGYLKGFIDLCFYDNGRYYIIDWKSNYEGAAAGDYTSQKLQQSVAGHSYFFQYYLYTLALCQFLRLKLPQFNYNRDFGGVFYIYLRGFALPRKHNDDLGVFGDKPPLKLINALGRLLVSNFTNFEE